MPEFIPGLELSRRFYWEAVRPILDEQFPTLPHAAALIGYGSEVLGFDDETSTDHNWYPMMLLFLKEEDAARGEEIEWVLQHHLPHEFLGYPVNSEPDPNDPDTCYMKLTTEGPVNHNIFSTTVRSFIQKYLAYDIQQPLEVADWLTFPAQKLLEVTAGGVHYDGVGELTAIRERLAYYPHDVWLYMLAAGWQRMSSSEGLMPRAGMVGDELGSSIIGARLVHDIMNLCFLMEKQYPPYPKWFGSAFKRLGCAKFLSPILWEVQCAATWQAREPALHKAYTFIAQMHNSLGITKWLPETVSNLEKRPYQVIHGEQFAQAILKQITATEVKRIAALTLIGGIDQWSDSTELRFQVYGRQILRQLFAGNRFSGNSINSG